MATQINLNPRSVPCPRCDAEPAEACRDMRNRHYPANIARVHPERELTALVALDLHQATEQVVR